MRKIFSQEVMPVILLLSIVSCILYAQIINKPAIFLNRGNDLQEFFWPIISYVKYNILNHLTIPLWNSLFLSGTPLLPDPQSPFWYLPNIIFLLFPIGEGFLILLIFHSIIGGIGSFLLARHGCKFSTLTSIFVSLLYIATPKLIGHVEAGHYGIINSYAWIPFIALSTILMVRQPKFQWSLLYAISSTSLFFNHLPTFLITNTAGVTLFAYLILQTKAKRNKAFYFLLTGVFLVIGLTAIALLPQLDWINETTRTLLMTDTNTYPRWFGKAEFIQALLWPWNIVKTLDTEKWIAAGLITIILAGWGFLQIKRRRLQFILISIFIVLILLSLNNVSPIHSFLINQTWFLYLRVATRVWFISHFIIILLAGFCVDKLLQTKIPKFIIAFLAALAIIEVFTLAWMRINLPVSDQTKYASQEVFEFLKNDHEHFRVFCTNRCLSQKQIADYHLETIEGYSTLQQKNYFNEFIQLSQVYWNKYTLALPPFEIYNFQEIQPYAPELADYNVKYVIAPYKLKDAHLIPQITYGTYTIYKNSLYKSRAYFTDGTNANITYYSPNFIRVDVSNHKSDKLILAEVYNSGWQAYLDGTKITPIQETKNALREVDLKPETKFVEFRYFPKSFLAGIIITVTTIIIVCAFALNTLKSKLKP